VRRAVGWTTFYLWDIALPPGIVACLVEFFTADSAGSAEAIWQSLALSGQGRFFAVGFDRF
jgi:hypothetical protein